MRVQIIAAWLAVIFVVAIVSGGAASDYVTFPPLKKWLFTVVAVVLTVSLLRWYWQKHRKLVVLWLCLAWGFVLVMWVWN